MNYFITGTDTNVGKTFVTCLLLKALVSAGHRAAGFKAVASGGRSDAESLLAASAPGLTLDEINPCWFSVPLAPLAAGKFERRAVDFPAIDSAYKNVDRSYSPVLVEGAGGWETPLAKGKTVADLALLLGLPVVVVADNKLGALNHTILTVRSIQARGLRCGGVFLNHTQPERDAASISNRAVLEEILDVPVLADITYGETELCWPDELQA